jgi:hypothetical protein
LAYKQQTTKPIPYDTASNSLLTQYLEALPTIGQGGVAVTLGTITACLAGSAGIFEVTFLQDFGNIPSLVSNGSKLVGANALLSVSTLQQGEVETKQMILLTRLHRDKGK